MIIEAEEIQSDLSSLNAQLILSEQTKHNELESFCHKLQNWISLSSDSTLDELAEQLSKQFELQQQETIIPMVENQTQTIELSEKVHIATETILLKYENQETQIDYVGTNEQEIQTDSFQQLWSLVSYQN